MNRDQLIARARKAREEIKQIFDDAEHWNRVNPNEEPIDPDPNGELKRTADLIDEQMRRLFV